MKVNREKLLNKLVCAEIALSPKETISQSDHIIITDNKMISFDGECLIVQETPLDFSVAIPASEFIKIVKQFPDAAIDLSITDGHMVIKGAQRRAGIRIAPDIQNPYREIMEMSVKADYKPINPKLRTALLLAAQTCGKDETAPKTTHVHINTDRVEATDSFCAVRSTIKTGFPNPVLLHRSLAYKCCKFFGLSAVAITGGWLHFRLATDPTVLSVLASMDSYYPREAMDRFLDATGEKIRIPKEILNVLKRAEIMNGEDGRVQVSLKDQYIKITARKDTGWFQERQELDYSGPPLCFVVHPAFLRQVLNQTLNVMICKKQIKVEQGRMVFTTYLEVA